MLLQAEGGEKLDNAIRAFVALGQEHLDKARSAGAIPKNLMSAFLPVSLVPSILAQADRKAGSVLTAFSPSPQWLRQIRMLRGLIRNRI